MFTVVAFIRSSGVASYDDFGGEILDLVGVYALADVGDCNINW